MALKWAADAWVGAPAGEKAAAFSAAQALRWTEYSFQSYSNVLLGITLILYGLSTAMGTLFRRWLGWVAIGSGVAWTVHGLMVPYIGLFNSILRLVAIALMGVWAFVMGHRMWRNSGGRLSLAA